MEIKTFKDEDKFVSFNIVKHGQVFKKAGRFFMRAYLLYSERSCAVSLENGEVTDFPGDTCVEIIKGYFQETKK